MEYRYWWGNNRKEPSGRMVTEITAIKRVFDPKKPTRVNTSVGWDNDFIIETLSRDLNTDDPQTPYWLISFRLKEMTRRSRIRSDDVYTIKVVYPSNYPHDEPRVTLESHSVGNSPHIFPLSGGVLCLYDHGSSRSRGWDPAKSTAATFGLWSAEWVRAWLYWKRFDEWPEEG